MKEKSVLIRVAIAVSEKKTENELIDQLTVYSIQTNHEVEFTKLKMDYDSLQKNICKFDIAVLDFIFLDSNKDKLLFLYESNPKCLFILLGHQKSRVCDFLDLRPGGYIDLLREDDSSEYILSRICSQIVKQIQNSSEILQFATKKGIYSISVKDILYCQSDLKYIVIMTKDGKGFRKIGKLTEIIQQLPQNFIRIHQSYLINSFSICGCDKSNHEVILEGDNRIPYSKAYHDVVNQMFQKYPYEG